MIKQDIKNYIKKKLVEDELTQNEIAEEVGVSSRTVKRVKAEMQKETGGADLATSLTDNQENDNTIYKKLQEKEEQKRKNAEFYEDSEEGWVFNISKQEIKALGSSRFWMGIVYPESAPPDWQEKLINLYCELAISPLHDRDLWGHDSPLLIDEETGEILFQEGERYKKGHLKKEHWHFLIKFDKPTGFREANNLIRKITNGPLLQKVKSLRGAFEYLAHANEDPTKKHHYGLENIERYNNFVLEPTKTDCARMLVEIVDRIGQNQYTSLQEVINFYRDLPEYIIVIGTKAYAIQKILDAEWRKQNPNGRIQRVQIVAPDKKENEVLSND